MRQLWLVACVLAFGSQLFSEPAGPDPASDPVDALDDALQERSADQPVSLAQPSRLDQSGPRLGAAPAAAPVAGLPAPNHPAPGDPSRFPEPTAPYLEAAQKKMGQKDAAGALAAVRAGLKSHPDDEQLIALENLLSQTLVKTTAVSPNVMAQVRYLLDLKQDSPIGGEEPLVSAVGSSPGRSPAQALGVKASDFRPAVQAPRSPELAAAVKKLGLDRREGERMLARLTRKNPADPHPFGFLGVSALETGRFAQAARHFRDALERAPKEGALWRLRGLSLRELGLTQEALQNYAEGLRLNPQDASLWAERGRLRLELGDEGGLEDLREAAERHPAEFGGVYEKALAEYGRRRPAGGWSRWIARNKTPLSIGAVPFALLLLLVLLRRREEVAVTVRTLGDTARRELSGIAAGEPPFQAAELPHRLTAGDAVNGFEIVRRIGRGGMGVVYEGIDRALNRRVAIKRMRAEISDNPRERARFLKEARTVAALSHPQIISIHSVFEKDDGLYLVFEYVDGETLDDLLGRQRVVAPELVSSIIRQAGQALDYAHAKGVVHRDLKPANIMLSRDGTAKVMDFGIARLANETLSRLTRAEIVGTPAYMAPEQHQGEATKLSDLYALGLCLYEMLAGDLPFKFDPYSQKMRKSFKPLSEIDPRLPKTIDAVISKALEPNPAARFASAAELARAAEAVLSDFRSRR